MFYPAVWPGGALISIAVTTAEMTKWLYGIETARHERFVLALINSYQNATLQTTAVAE